MARQALRAFEHDTFGNTESTIRGVVKTTLYLPDDLKRQVEDAAHRRGISKAEFYREALRQAVSLPRPKPKGALFASGTGPGTSDLSSQCERALARLAEAD